MKCDGWGWGNCWLFSRRTQKIYIYVLNLSLFKHSLNQSAMQILCRGKRIWRKCSTEFYFFKNSSCLGIVSEIFSIRHLTYLLILTKIRSLFLDWFRDNFESRSNNLWFGIYIIEHSHIHILAVGTYLFIWSPDFLMSLVTSASDLTCMFSNCMRSIISIMGPR